MKIKSLRYSLIGLMLLSFGSLWANTASAQGVVESDESSDRWRSSLFLYIWGTGLKGTAAVRGNEVEIDESFSDLVEELAGAFSARFESHKGRWGYFVDGMYVKLDPSATTPVGTISTETKQWIVEGGGIYHFNTKVQALFGFRYQDLDLDLNFPSGVGRGGSQSWTDGILGLRLVPVNTDRWRIWLRGDVGVVGDSDSTWNAVVGVGYLFNPRWSVALAYRLLSTDYRDGGFKWDIEQSGLGLAVGYTFQ